MSSKQYEITITNIEEQIKRITLRWGFAIKNLKKYSSQVYTWLEQHEEHELIADTEWNNGGFPSLDSVERALNAIIPAQIFEVITPKEVANLGLAKEDNAR